MLGDNKLIVCASLAVGLLAYYFKVGLNSEAVSLIGVMFSVFFGFYVSSLAFLFGNSVVRFLHEMPKHNFPGQTLLPDFCRDLLVCAGACLCLVVVLIVYVVLSEKLSRVWAPSGFVLSALIFALCVFSLSKLSQMFYLMLKLMQYEAPYIRRSTLHDVESARKSELRGLETDEDEGWK